MQDGLFQTGVAIGIGILLIVCRILVNRQTILRLIGIHQVLSRIGTSIRLVATSKAARRARPFDSVSGPDRTGKDILRIQDRVVNETIIIVIVRVTCTIKTIGTSPQGTVGIDEIFSGLSSCLPPALVVAGIMQR